MGLTTKRTYKPNGPKIAELRNKQGLSQRQLAKKAIVSISRLQEIELDEGECFVWMLARIAKALGVKWNEIARDAETGKVSLPMQLISLATRIAYADSHEERMFLLEEYYSAAGVVPTAIGLGCLIIGMTVPGAFFLLVVGAAIAGFGCFITAKEPRLLALYCILLFLNLAGAVYVVQHRPQVGRPVVPAAVPPKNQEKPAVVPKPDIEPVAAGMPPPLPSVATDPNARRAVDRCVALTRQCQLDDGALRMNSDGTPAWIEPYFASYGALGLLAASDHSRSPEDIKRVAAWLNWYVDHIDPTLGVPPEFNGLVTDYRRSDPPDSVDAYAGLFLMTVSRYHAKSGVLDPKIHEASKKMVNTLESLLEPDGLTVAKPDFRNKYLMDNLEVYWGCVEAQKLFSNLKDTTNAGKAKSIADNIANGIQKFRLRDYFAYSITTNGMVFDDAGLGNRGLANLFVLASSEKPNKDLWQTLVYKYHYAPDDGNAAQAGLQWWIIAARESAPHQEAKALYDRAIAQAEAFDNKTYINRLGLMALAMTNGNSRFPTVAVRQNPVGKK